MDSGVVTSSGGSGSQDTYQNLPPAKRRPPPPPPSHPQETRELSPEGPPPALPPRRSVEQLFIGSSLVGSISWLSITYRASSNARDIGSSCHYLKIYHLISNDSTRTHRNTKREENPSGLSLVQKHSLKVENRILKKSFRIPPPPPPPPPLPLFGVALCLRCSFIIFKD